ncbi:flagellar biosynthetic protein FliR [uncultured Aliiroseovarius sp.]|uniref:flagellar biosynthetic protein FliR n=1 Tax=uncultured Aliiroseovarius sp. TaxID=1658783 RepID=UPI002628D41A|nr:flagellar biosynthetic protein FliR [uncultured Aliiroseovarius sp.]
MNDQLAQIMAQSQAFVMLGFVVFLRVGAAMALLPAFGETMVPVRVRLFLGFAFTVIVTPAVANTVTPSVEQLGSPIYLMSEPIVGLGFGIILRLAIMTLQIAGSIAAQSTSLAQLMGGNNSDPQPAIGHVLTISGLALAAMLGLHVRIVEGFILSYQVFPVGALPDPLGFSDWGITHVAHSFGFAFALAAPFVIVSLLYNVALGVINRAMPQLMVAFVGAPAITAGGLILLALTTPVLLPIWQRAFEALLLNPFGGW